MPLALVRLDSQKLPTAEGLPSRLKLLSWGANPSSKGTWILNETSAAQLPVNQKRANFDRVALDFNHNSVPGSESYKGEPVLVAAHGDPRLIAGDGLYLENLEWTPEGREFVGGRHYIDLSPTILPNEKGEVLFLHSAAVCRQGSVHGLSILSAGTPQLTQLIQTLTTNMTDYRPLVCALLGLSADATDLQITTASEAAKKRPDHRKTLAGLLNLSADATDAEIETAAEEMAKKEKKDDKKELVTNAGDLAALRARIDQLETNAATTAIDEIRRLAAAEGKVIPGEILAGPVGKDAGQLRALVASLPSTVPLEQRTGARPAPETSGLVTNSADDTVRKTLGITKEAWEKHNAK